MSVSKDLAEIKESLVEIKTDLRYHIKRTNILEAKVTPLEDHAKFVQTLMKLIAWLVAISVPMTAVLRRLIN